MFGPIKLPPRPHPRIASVFDLEFRRELGKGAFATVYEAFHRRTNTTYAVKKLRFSQLRAADMRNVENELAIHSQLVHPNIIQFIDYIAEPKAIFLVLEFMPRGNLFQYMRRQKVREDEAARIFVQVAGVLGFLHARGIILRDLKPENILIDEKMNVKICDFGWATFVDNTDYCRSVAGTYCYMSPEGLRGEMQSEKSDLWSLGVLLYELLFNREPFAGRSPNELLEKIYYEGFTVEAGADPQAVELMAGLLRAEAKERMPLQAVLRSAWVRKLSSLCSLEENKTNDIVGLPKILLNDSSKADLKSRTNLKGVEIIKKSPTLAGSKLAGISETVGRSDIKSTSQPPIAVPPMTAQGKKPFQNFGDLLNLSRLTSNHNVSIFGPTKSRSPDGLSRKPDPSHLQSSHEPQSTLLSPNSLKQGPDQKIRFEKAHTIGAVVPTFQSPFQEPVQSIKDTHSGQGVTPFRLAGAASPEPSTIRSRLNVTIDHSKRGVSPSLIASVNNSHIEVVLGENNPELFKNHTRPDNSILRDLAVNRKMVFSSPASKPSIAFGSPIPSRIPVPAESNRNIFHPQPDSRELRTPSMPTGSFQQLSLTPAPVKKGPSIMDAVYKKSSLQVDNGNVYGPKTVHRNENTPLNRRTPNQPPATPGPHPPSSQLRSESTIGHPGKNGGTFGKFLDSMRSLARNW